MLGGRNQVTIFTFILEEEARAEPLDTETDSLTEPLEEEMAASGQLSNSKTKIEANDSKLEIRVTRYGWHW